MLEQLEKIEKFEKNFDDGSTLCGKDGTDIRDFFRANDWYLESRGQDVERWEFSSHRRPVVIIGNCWNYGKYRTEFLNDARIKDLCQEVYDLYGYYYDFMKGILNDEDSGSLEDYDSMRNKLVYILKYEWLES